MLESAQAIAATTEPARGGDGLRVLVVDDSHHVLRAARSLLETVPRIAEVVTAFSGRMALELSARQSFDLVILDLAMDGLNGLDVARELRGRAGSPRIIMMSLYDEAEFSAAAIAAGADVLVHKPNLAAQLEPLLQSLFGPIAA